MIYVNKIKTTKQIDGFLIHIETQKSEFTSMMSVILWYNTRIYIKKNSSQCSAGSSSIPIVYRTI